MQKNPGSINVISDFHFKKIEKPKKISIDNSKSKKHGDIISITRPLNISKNHQSRLMFYSILAPKLKQDIEARPKKGFKTANMTEKMSTFVFENELESKFQSDRNLRIAVDNYRNNHKSRKQKVKDSYKNHLTTLKIKKLKAKRIIKQ